MISQEVIEEIRQKADIVDVISTYINVIKKGNSFLAVCPFHNDKNPSLQISRTKQIYKCFSCNAGGNVFTFVQDYEKVSFIDAVRKVASIIGFNSKELDQPTRVISDQVKNTLNALKIATELYSYTLKTREGLEAIEYLNSRNIPEEMIDYFNLGFSPKDGELSIKMMRGKDISIEDLDQAGIIVRNNNQFLDRFKGRLIFPLSNEYGEVVGFSARRIVNSDEAKYINSLNTCVFNKSKVLYNFQNALKEAKKEGYVYITEGFMDVFSLYKIGIKSSVAIMGTAFTDFHAKMLRKLNVELRLCLDGDEAGQHGILKMIEILDKEHLNYQIVNYGTSTQDPDEILENYGPEVLKKLLSRLITREEFIINYHKKKYDLTSISGKKDFSNQVIKYAKNIDNPIDKEVFLKTISSLTGISYESYQSMVANQSKNASNKFYDFGKNKISENSIPRRISRYERVQNELIRLLLNYQDAIEKFKEGNNYFYDELYNNIANYIIDYYSLNHSIGVSDFISFISQQNDDLSKRIINKIIEIEGMETNKGLEYSEALFNEYIGKLNDEIEKIKTFNNVKNTNIKNDTNQKANYLANHLKKIKEV